MVEARLKPPEYLSLHGNVAENWRRWHQRFELYMLAIEADSKPNCTKIAILFSAKTDALERYNHFKWDGSPNDPPNNPPVPDDNNQQGNAQPAQNNAAKANDKWTWICLGKARRIREISILYLWEGGGTALRRQYHGTTHTC